MGQKTRVTGRAAKWAIGGALAFGLVGVVGFLVAPPLVKSLAERQLGEMFHRPVSIDGISINPYALSAEVRGFRMQEREGGQTALGFASLYANVQLESLFRGGAVVSEVRLVEPVVRVVREEGLRFNWSDVIDEMLAKPDDGGQSYFAVHNIRIEKGRIDFDDKPAGKQHVIADLELGVPFVSNLPTQVETFVEPLLSMKVNDAPFEIRGKAKPFAPDRESVVDLKFSGFDLGRYVDYLPVDKTFRLASARLSSDLQLSFAQPPGGTPDVVVKGELALDEVDLRHADNRPALRLASLKLGVERLAPLAREVAIATLAIEKPEVVVARDRDGRLSLLDLLPARQPAPATAEKPAAATPARSLALSVGELRVSGGQVDFTDALAGGPFHRRLQDIHLSLRKFSLAGKGPAELEAGLVTDASEKLTHKGTLALAPLRLAGTVRLEGLDLVSPRPYYAPFLPQGEIQSGRVDAGFGYVFEQGAAGEPLLRVEGGSLNLRDVGLQLKGEKTPLARIGLLEVKDAGLDLATRRVVVGSVTGRATRFALVRDKDGAFNVGKLAGGPAPEAVSAARPTPRPAARAVGRPASPPAPDWQLDVKHLALDDWGLRLEDRTLAPAVVLGVEPLGLTVDGLSTARGSKATLKLQAAVNKRGRVGVAGTVGLAPLAAALDLDLKTVDLAMLQPYVTEQVNIAITRGNTSARGRLVFELPPAGGPKASYKGSFTIADFASVDKLNAADFLKWKSLNFAGMDVRLSPLSVSIDEIALADFYTRLILNAQGGLNLREITAQQAKEAKDRQLAEARSNGGKAPASRVATARLATAEPAAPLPPILIKRVTVQGGNIAFSDRFVRPNYDVNLTGMGGSLTGLSSDPSTIASLDLRGKVDDSAPVTVAGSFNPFRQDKALDIRAAVKDFELSGVSTYSAKYVGYGIEKGKLSAELNYKVADRRLTATNQVFLDQLTFGDAVDSPDALKLPVTLAVSLLKNSRGEIDLNLPIGGSLDDPEFSVGGLVFKVIVNLLTKAITSPFALVGSLFGGNAEELSWLDFEPGFARLPEGAETKLAAIAKALKDRPALKLEISGRVDPARDPEGLKRAVLEGKVEALKVKDMARKGESADEDGEVRVAPAEYPALLARVYKSEDFPKPRNLVGLVKDLPVAEMEKLILANTTVDADDVRLLAQQRAQAVRRWLRDKGQVPAERIFILAPRGEDGSAHAKARPSRVDFSLR
ncbi:DUF748 domain-containing protein [Zoogloea sp.]|uniref:DUF748 domain-containing protein n=1 Tax=Zoogloea sp. TaxID=49181 RepID=UPI0014165E52|nr:MAG: DUF748 domain-containing protein [Zoogloea sp.]